MKKVLGSEFIVAVCKALEISSERVRQITIDATWGDLAVIHIYQIADERILPAIADIIVTHMEEKPQDE